MRLLITGFPPYDRYKQNCTQLLIESLRADRPRALADAALDIVAFENGDAATLQRTMLAELERVLIEHEPQVCLFCGQSPDRPRVTVEMLAVNVFKGQVIEPEGPPACWATLPGLKGLTGRLLEAGIPAADSWHAGTHLCNHILYSALRRGQRGELPRYCGFVHLPMTTGQVIADRENRPSLPLPVLRRAIVETVGHVRETM